MSTATNRNFTRNQLSTDYDFSKTFRFANSYIKGEFINDTGAEVTLKIGTVLGRKASDASLKVLKFDAADGSQFPVGVCAEEVVVAIAGAVPDLYVCNSGDINLSSIILPAGTTLDSVISDKILRDRIVSDSKGIRLVPVTQNTSFNNF